ncbi:ATP-binding protein [Coralloluteibacterium stylophorae]|uniref:Sensory/regulatory protein RpfC n=1 Tax=Coralloluteibacterium stylophorae TaxID=1776034 RepID=A0A8J7VRX1_9GAMM|nr:ATP-binding protein [Coralloluteibacterium stylophorae]MBS7456709.1 response regulator [Coralloluteibacterium stylophorae]
MNLGRTAGRSDSASDFFSRGALTSRRKVLLACVIGWLLLTAYDVSLLPPPGLAAGGFAALLLLAMHVPALLLLALAGVLSMRDGSRRPLVDRLLPLILLAALCSTSAIDVVLRHHADVDELRLAFAPLLLITGVLLAPFGLKLRSTLGTVIAFLAFDLLARMVSIEDASSQRHGVAAWFLLLVNTALCAYAAHLQQRERVEQFESQRRLDDILGNLPIAVFTYDPHARGFPHIAGDTSALFGVDAETMMRNGLDSVYAHLPPEACADIRDAADMLAEQPQELRREFRIPHRDGVRWVEVHSTPYRSLTGKVRLAGYWADVTVRHEQNAAMQAAQEAAEAAAAAKSGFLAMMSHEIRTPVNAIMGMIELLDGTTLDPEQRYMVRTVDASAEALLRILDDVLDFSRIEAGKFVLDPAPFSPRELVDHVVGIVAPGVRRKGLRIYAEVDHRIAGILVGDAWRLRQILLNLLGNAIKFTDSGRIRVALRMVGESDGDAGRQRIELMVADTGSGIPSEQQATLFEPFVQAADAADRRREGAGLGLAICRSLVDLMQGSIRLESAPGEGTRITIALTLDVRRRDAANDDLLRGCTAHVRDADPALVSSLGQHLRALGIAVNSDFRRSADGARPSVELSCTGPGTGDGGDRPRRIQLVDRQFPLGYGVDDGAVLLGTNPLEWRAVLPACREALGLPASTEHAAGQGEAAPPARAPQRILVAEDHPTNQALVRRQLDRLGYDCDVVGDGREALQRLQDGDYALLITDCHMPGMDGYELTRQLRTQEAGSGRHLPVIAMTANALPSEITRCLAVGMDDHLGKPVRLRRLDDMLARWLGGDDAVAAEPPGGRHGPDLATLREALAAEDVVAVLRSMADVTLQDLPALYQCLETRDADGTRQWLHRAVGALQTLGSHPVIDAGRMLIDRLAAEGDAALPAASGYAVRVAEFAEHLHAIARAEEGAHAP